MTVRVFESAESRKRSASVDFDNSATLQWVCTGTTDDQIAGDAILADAPTTFRGLVYKSISLSELGCDMWIGDLTYVNAKNKREKNEPDTGEFTFSVQSGDAKQKIRFTKAGRTTRYPGTATDFKGAIGVDNSDGKIVVEGVEIPIAGGSVLTLHYRVPLANITIAYIKTLDSLRGHRNTAAFYGFDAKELLFLGHNASDGVKSDPVVDFRFRLDINLVGIQIGDIAGIDKPAHDHMDVHWEYEADATTNVLIPKPKAVYVHDLLDTADFADLGIGTTLP